MRLVIKIILVFFTCLLLLSMFPPKASAATDCSRDCMEKRTATAEARMRKYLDVAETAMKADSIGVSLKSEQRQWGLYRETHCGMVLEYWRSGSIALNKMNECLARMANQRTKEIWDSYLSYPDSTKPLLPDPSRLTVH